MSNLQKSLAELIDETLAEIETLKKSERYSAHEIELGEPKANGSMETSSVQKADKKDEEDEEEKEEDEAKKSDDDDDEDDMAKAEDDCKKADEACEKAMKKYEMCKAEAEHKKKMFAMKKGEASKEEKEDKKDDKEEKELKKSIDARVAPLEAKISDVLAAVKRLAEAPVPARGTSYRSVQPLAKSNDVEPLSKAAVVNRLVDLKKSGTNVASEDVISLETGSGDVQAIANKYGIK